MTIISHNTEIGALPDAITLGELVARDETVLGAAPAWVRFVRDAALRRARSLGMPARTDEAWRATNPRPLLEPAYAITVPHEWRHADAVTKDGSVPIRAAARLVFVDGVFARSHSESGALPPGLEVMPLDEAFETHADVLRPIMAREIDQARDGLEALAAGLSRCGAVIRVEEGACIEHPVVLTFRASGRGGTPVLAVPRVVVIVGKGAEIGVIEDHTGAEGAAGLTLAASTVLAEERARAWHTLIGRDAVSRNMVTTLRTRQGAESRVVSHRVLAGGGVVRNNVIATLAGAGADAVLNGLYLPEGRQHHDNHMRVEHAAPHCTSRQHYRGVLADRARGVFTGRIVVDPEAQKTDAVQSNANLLLSRGAEVNSRPQLEIYADDVRCTHGATTGQMDDDALFYLRSRGLGRDGARLILLRAFAGDIVDRIGHESLREWTRGLVGDRLAGALGRIGTTDGGSV